MESVIDFAWNHRTIIVEYAVAATDEEHERCFLATQSVAEALTEMGFPRPVVIDSGNGFYLLYRIDLPNDDASLKLITRCIKAVQMLTTDSTVHVDPTMSNASRIFRIPGTPNRKGENCPTVGRIHRLAHIVEAPDSLEIVPKELLEKLAAVLPEDKPKSKVRKERGSFDLSKWLKDHDLEVAYTKRRSDATLFHLSSCPWNPDHQKDAYLLEYDDGGIFAGCHHAKCPGARTKGNHWKDLRSRYEVDADDLEVDVDLDPDPKSAGKRDEHIQVAQELVKLGMTVEMFIDAQRGDAYAVVPSGEKLLVVPVDSKRFKMWLSKTFYDKTEKVAGSENLSSAVMILCASLQADGNRIQLWNRFAVPPYDADDGVYDGAGSPSTKTTASHNASDDVDGVDGLFGKVRGAREKIIVDMGDDIRHIEVTPRVWRLKENEAPMFRRFKHQQTLPEPVRNGDIKKLLPYLNLKTDTDKMLVLVWLVVALVATIPRAILSLCGAEGSAKSTLAKLLRSILDPSGAPDLHLDNDLKELAQVLDHHAIPIFDNIRTVSNPVADMLCKAVTGGGLTKRALYTDEDDVLMTFKRAMITTSINIPFRTPDLLDRTMTVHLERIGDDRKEEADIYAEFERDKPEILGGLLDALVEAMLIRPTIKLKNPHRLADFARWGEAAARALGYEEDAFIEALAENSRQHVEEVLEGDPVARTLLAVLQDLEKSAVSFEEAVTQRKDAGGVTKAMRDGDVFEYFNTPTEWHQLFKETWEKVTGREWSKDSKNFPAQPNLLSRRLGILQAKLADNNISVYLNQHQGKDRSIRMTWHSISDGKVHENLAAPGNGSNTTPYGGDGGLSAVEDLDVP